MFLAHANFLKENQHVPVIQYNNEKVLTRTAAGYTLISNICPHQKSLITTKLTEGNRICPYHNWSFDVYGHPISSGRTKHYCENKNSLETTTVYNWNNLLFSTNVDFDYKLDTENLSLVEQRIDIVKSTSETIMDIFLDVDHIPTVHKGVYDSIGITDIDNIVWTYYNNGSIQTVPGNAVWISIYPNTMIELQQGSLFITVAVDIDSKLSKVHVFKYKDKNNDSNHTLNETVWETAWEQDKIQAELIVERNTTNLETQKQHFRNWQNGSIV